MAINRTNQGDNSKGEGFPLENITYELHETHVTGHATARGTTFGEAAVFQIMIDGQSDAVKSFAAEARIIELSVDHVRSGDMKRISSELLRARRTSWKAQIRAMQKRIDTVDTTVLADPDKVWQLRSDLEKSIRVFEKPDLKKDRIISIVPPEVPGEEPFVLRLVIDPSLLQGQSDYYVPVANAAHVSATTRPTDGGDVDLYLANNGATVDISLFDAGSAEAVEGIGNSKGWMLQVKGFTAVTYEEIANWVFVNRA